MPNCRNDGHWRGDDRSRDDLLIEGPEIFDRPTAPADDHHVDTWHPYDVGEPARDIGRSSLALDARWTNHQMRVRVAPAEHFDDVLDRGAVERSHDPDFAGECR
jgi:hypothetical protein